MPTEIRVVDFTDQTGETQTTAIDNLRGEDPDVLIVIDPQYSTSFATGLVISQSVANVAIEAAGGPVGSHGVQVTLVVSLGEPVWFESAVNAAEALKRRYAPFLAVDFDFPSGHVRLWTGYGVIKIAGNTYTGAGFLGRISPLNERSNLSVEEKSYQLAGAPVDPALVPEDDIDNSFGRSVTEYLGFLDPVTRTLLDTPEIIFEGEMSSIKRKDGSEPLIEVNAVSRLITLNQVDGWRYTDEHQQLFYAGDRGLDLVPTIETREVLWGGQRVTPGTVGSGGGRDRRERDQPRPP